MTIPKRFMPEDSATALLKHSFSNSDDAVVVDVGEASQILKEGNFSDYRAFRSLCSDRGAVTFDRLQLQRDAGLLPANSTAETLTTEGRIDANGKGRNF